MPMTAIETLNHWGACFTDFAPRILAQSSLLMMILFALDLALRKKVRAVFRYGLWLLVLVKLILPPSFASPTSLAYWIPDGKSAASDRLIPLPVEVRQSEIRIDSPAPSAAKALPPAGPRLSWSALILIGWAIGAVGLFWFLIHRSRYVARQVKAATDASDDLIALLNQCGAQMRLRRALRLKLARSPMSPAVCGFRRPVVLISTQLAERLSVSELRAVLLHEF